MPALDLPELDRLITSVMPGDQIPWSGIATILWHLTQHHTMTALNFRKNMREFFPWAVTATKTTVKVATKTCQSINASEKLHDIRCRAAALMMPNDMAFVITPKENI